MITFISPIRMNGLKTASSLLKGRLLAGLANRNFLCLLTRHKMELCLHFPLMDAEHTTHLSIKLSPLISQSLKSMYQSTVFMLVCAALYVCKHTVSSPALLKGHQPLALFCWNMEIFSTTSVNISNLHDFAVFAPRGKPWRSNSSLVASFLVAFFATPNTGWPSGKWEKGQKWPEFSFNVQTVAHTVHIFAVMLNCLSDLVFLLKNSGAVLKIFSHVRSFVTLSSSLLKFISAVFSFAVCRDNYDSEITTQEGLLTFKSAWRSLLQSFNQSFVCVHTSYHLSDALFIQIAGMNAVA